MISYLLAAGGISAGITLYTMYSEDGYIDTKVGKNKQIINQIMRENRKKRIFDECDMELFK